ncbi:MAG: hypothetical protein WEF86_06325 [Gemmatimonadota bacterium]
MQDAPICRCSTAAPVLAILVLLAFTRCAAGDATEGISYQPDRNLPRLDAAATAPRDAGLIRDFDIAGDTMVLLDRTGSVFVLERGSDGWAPVRRFGRAGDGPGELRNASGIDLTPQGDVAVVESTRLQFLRTDGAVVSTRRLIAPCPMLLPGIASAGGGLFVYGDCYRTGFVTDTMKAVLGWTTDTAAYHVLAEEIRYTGDGRIGSVFGAQNAFAPGAGQRHVFGTGTTNCIWSITTAAAQLPVALRLCPAAGAEYSAPPPPGLEARLRSRRSMMARVTWPATLPAYLERVVAGESIILLRPYTADSLVLQLPAPDGRDLAVAPVNGLVSCKAGACLWVVADAEPMRLIVLDSARIAALLLAAKRRLP